MSSKIAWNIVGSCDVEIEAEEEVVSDELYDVGDEEELVIGGGDMDWERTFVSEAEGGEGPVEADTQGVRAAEVRTAVSISSSTTYFAT